MKTVEPPPEETKELSKSEKVLLAILAVGLVVMGTLMAISAPPV